MSFKGVCFSSYTQSNYPVWDTTAVSRGLFLCVYRGVVVGKAVWGVLSVCVCVRTPASSCAQRAGPPYSDHTYNNRRGEERDQMR